MAGGDKPPGKDLKLPGTELNPSRNILAQNGRGIGWRRHARRNRLDAPRNRLEASRNRMEQTAAGGGKPRTSSKRRSTSSAMHLRHNDKWPAPLMLKDTFKHPDMNTSTKDEVRVGDTAMMCTSHCLLVPCHPERSFTIDLSVQALAPNLSVVVFWGSCPRSAAM